MANTFFKRVAEYKKAHPGISHKAACDAVKADSNRVSVNLGDFVSVHDHAPKAISPDSTSGKLTLLLKDETVVDGYYRRWDKKVNDTDCPSARVSDGYFFTLNDGKELVIDFLLNPVIRFSESKN